MDDSDDQEDGMMYRDQLEFWGLKVLPGKPQPVSFDDNEEALVHITQVALDHAPGDTPSTVFLTVGGHRAAIGTLRKGKCDQFSVDLAVAENFTVEHTGTSAVYLTGWRQTLVTMEDSDEEGDDDDDEDEDEEEDEEPQPVKAKGKPAAAPVPVTKRPAPAPVGMKQQPAVKKGPAASQFFGDEDEDDDDDDDDEFAGAGDDEDDDDEEDDEEEEEERPAPVKAGKTPLKSALPKTPAPAAAAAKTPAKTPTAGVTGGKATPGAAGATTPITPAAGAGALKPVNASEYERDLVATLRKQGRTGMSALGGAVAKPADVPKLRAFLQARPQVFKMFGDQVELVGK